MKKEVTWTPEEWKGEDHPILTNYDTPKGLDMKKFFSKRRCGDDKEDIGLKMPDLISNTLLRSIQRQDDVRWIKILRRIYPNRSFVHKKHAGKGYYKIISFRAELYDVVPSVKIKTHWELVKKRQ